MKKTNAAWRPMGISVAGSFTSTTTLSIKAEAEAPFIRVRFRFYSEYGAATNFKFAAGATETALISPATTLAKSCQPVVGDTVYNAVQSAIGEPGWQIGAVAGVTNFNWPGAGSIGYPKELVTDWLEIPSVPRADGGSRPLILMRLEHDASANGGISSGSISAWTAGQNTATEWYRVLQAPNISGGGAVTDLTKNLAGSMGTVAVWCAVEFDYNRPAMTVLGIGDSNLDQGGTHSQFIFGTWGHRACAMVSTHNYPVVWFNCGLAGAANSLYSTNGLVELARVAPSLVVYAAGTSNDNPMTAAKLNQWKIQLAKTLAACTAANIPLCVYGPLPGINYQAEDEVFRVEMRKHCIEMANAGLFDYLDFELLLGTMESPNRLAPTMTAVENDGSRGTHVSNLAESLMAMELARVIRKYQ